jgi:hypothetical protein
MPDQVVSSRCLLGVVAFGERREPGRVYQFSRAQELDLSLASPGAFERVYPREQDLPRLSVDLRALPPVPMDVVPAGDGEQAPGADVFAGEEGTAGEDSKAEGISEAAMAEDAPDQETTGAAVSAPEAALAAVPAAETAEEAAESEAAEQAKQPDAEPEAGEQPGAEVEATEPGAAPDAGAKQAAPRRSRASGGRQRRGKKPASGAGE